MKKISLLKIVLITYLFSCPRKPLNYVTLMSCEWVEMKTKKKNAHTKCKQTDQIINYISST